jgi:hypothetical protein
VEVSAVPAGDRETLKRFLKSLRALLERLAQDPKELFRPELRRLVAVAWAELDAEGRFEEAEHRIDSGEYEQGLIDHGLRGAQLELKVATYEQSLQEMEADEERLFFSRAHMRKSVPKVLKTANVPLDSAAAFLPPLAAVPEFKSAAEAAIAKRASIKKFFQRLLKKEDRDVTETAGATSAS